MAPPGLDDLWSRLERRFGLDYHQARAELDRQIAEEPEKPTAIYLSPLRHAGCDPRLGAAGPTVCGAFWRQGAGDGGGVLCPPGGALDRDFYRELRGSEAALLFAPPLSRTVPTSWKFR